MSNTQTAKATRNVAIEFWRIIAAIAIIGFHTGWIIARSCNEATGYFMNTSNWFFGSSETLLIFTLTAGYFMYARFKKEQNNPAIAALTPTVRAWNYTWSRVKSLIPVLILGYLLGVILSTPFFYPEYTVQDYCVMIVNSAWEFLGFHATGLRSTGGQFFNLNGVLWFISAIVVGGYFMYYLLCKDSDRFAGFVCPLVFIFLAGWWAFTGTRAAQTAWSTLGSQLASTNGMGGSATSDTAFIGFNNGFIFVILGMMGGIILHQLIEVASRKEISGGMKGFLTVLNVICTALLIWYIIYQPTYFKLDRWTVALLQIVVIGLNLYNKDAFTAVLNNRVTAKALQYLGGISLYIYMLHYPIAIAVLRIFGKNSADAPYTFWQVFIPTVIATVILAAVTKKVMDATILKKKA